MHLKDVMKRAVEVVAPDTPLREAAQKMRSHNLAELPVCEGRKMVGLLTARDITMRATAQGRDPWSAEVREVMMTPAVYVHEEQDIHEAADLIQQWRLHQVPVLDGRMRLVGIVGLPDLCGGISRRSKLPASPAKHRVHTRGAHQH